MFDKRSDLHGPGHARLGRPSDADGIARTPGKRTHTELAGPIQPGSTPPVATAPGRDEPRGARASADPHADAIRPTLSSLFGGPAVQGAAGSMIDGPGERTLTESLPPRGSLPPAIRRDAEAIVGTSLADVRVHESAHAATLGAHAYTSGKDVVFAPGRYDTTSREGLSLLGHELAHVAQQGSGIIAGAQGKRGGVAFHGALERAADHAGERLAALSTPTAARAGAVASGGVCADQLVQAKLGFELESDGENKLLNLGRRETAYEDADFKIESDSDNSVEFVSTPKDTLEQLLGVVERIREAAKLLDDAVNEPDKPLPGYKLTPTEMGLQVGDKSWPVKPQQTAGLELHQLPAYLALRSPGPQGNSRATRNSKQQHQTFAKTDAHTQAAKQFDALIALTVYYLRSFKNMNILDEKEGPKAVLHFMLRNSFYDLYHSIPGCDEQLNKDAFREAVKTQMGGKDKYVFPHGYEIDDDKVTSPEEGAIDEEIQGTLTIDDWITQIFDGMQRPKYDGTGKEHVNTDGVSPPLPAMHRDQVDAETRKMVYGMGAYAMDGNLALLEQRGQAALTLMNGDEVERWLTAFVGHVDVAKAPEGEEGEEGEKGEKGEKGESRGRQEVLAPSPFEKAVNALQVPKEDSSVTPTKRKKSTKGERPNKTSASSEEKKTKKKTTTKKKAKPNTTPSKKKRNVKERSPENRGVTGEEPEKKKQKQEKETKTEEKQDRSFEKEEVKEKDPYASQHQELDDEGFPRYDPAQFDDGF